jgi:hypothetical protein
MVANLGWKLRRLFSDSWVTIHTTYIEWMTGALILDSAPNGEVQRYLINTPLRIYVKWGLDS